LYMKESSAYLPKVTIVVCAFSI